MTNKFSPSPKLRYVWATVTAGMFLLVLCATHAYAQGGGARQQLPPELMPKHPAGREAARAK